MHVQKLALMLVPPVVVVMALMPMLVLFMVISTMSHAINIKRARVRACLWLVVYLCIRATCMTVVGNLRVRHMTVFRFALIVQPRHFGFVNGANNKAAENSMKNYKSDFAINSKRTVVSYFSANCVFFHV